MAVRTIVLVVLALVCGVSAAVGVSQLTRQNQNTALQAARVPVVVAAVDVPRGATLSADLVKIQEWPQAVVPLGALAKVEDTTDRSVLVPLVAGEPVLERKLAGKGAGRGLASMIPVGMRAFTIQTSGPSSGVGGFILPGNKVDVLLTTTGFGNETTGGGATTTLLQNVEILAVAQRLNAPDANRVDPRELTNVTVLVTPDQAAKLDLGMNKGTLHLTLRNPEDEREARTSPATLAQLMFYQEKPAGTRSQVANVLGEVAQAVVAGMTAHGSAVSNPERQASELPAQGEAAPHPTGQMYIQTLRGVHYGLIRIEQR